LVAIPRFLPSGVHFDFLNKLWQADFSYVIFPKMREARKTAKTLAALFEAKIQLDRNYAKSLRKLLVANSAIQEEESVF
jgi:hypothetical protein